MSGPIVVSNLSAFPGIGQIYLTWSLSDPNAQGLPYLALDAVEVFAAASDNRALAVKVAEGRTSAIVPVEGFVSLYFWIRPRNAAGSHGPWHPATTTGGVLGATIGTLIAAAIAATTFTGSVINGATINGGVLNVSPGSGYGMVINVPGGGNGVDLNIAGSGIGFDIDHTGGGRAFDVDMSGGGSAFVATCNAGGSAVQVTHSGGGAGLLVSHTGGGEGVSVYQTGGGVGIRSQRTSAGFAFYAAASGGATAYGPFTGGHDALLPKGVRIEPGDVVCDVRVVARLGVSDTITEIALSSEPRQRTAVGVFVGRRRIRFDASPIAAMERFDRATARAFDLVNFNGLGEGQINVCGENGPIAPGDLLVTSSMPGKAMRQDDDVIRSCTVAKAREAADPGAGTAQIACVYISG